MQARVLVFLFCGLIAVALGQNNNGNTTPVFVAVRFFHGVANGPTVSVFFDEQETFAEVDFGGLTDYVTVEAGLYDFAIRQANSGAVVYEIYEYTLPDNNDYITLVFQGTRSLVDDSPFSVNILTDTDNSSGSKGVVRFYHAAADYAQVDLILGGNTIFSDISFGDKPKSQSVSDTVYDSSVVFTKNQAVIVDSVLVDIPSGVVTTLFFVGAPDSSSDVPQLVVAYDGAQQPVTYSNGASALLPAISLLFAVLLVIC